jgi:LPXTG-site transpeptidase (sortase) family protein
MRKLLVFFLLLTGILLLISKEPKEKEMVNNISNKTIDNWVINIPKINLNEIVRLTTIKSKDINGVVLFKEYGRPNKKESNIIIGAHSGIGPNAIFNNIDKLEVGDTVFFYYERVHFTYRVVKKYQVAETNLSPLNKGGNKNLLTLMTCSKNNSKKRLIVVSEQI